MGADTEDGDGKSGATHAQRKLRGTGRYCSMRSGDAPVFRSSASFVQPAEQDRQDHRNPGAGGNGDDSTAMGASTVHENVRPLQEHPLPVLLDALVLGGLTASSM